MPKVRIVVATTFPADPASPRGGVEGVSVVLVQALARQPDLDVHVVTADAACPESQTSSWAGATIHRLPWRARRMLSGSTGEAGRLVQQKVEALAPDVVHAHDTYGIMLAGLRTPRALTIHGFIYADTLVSGERFAWIRSRMWRRVETAAWARYPHVISISPYVTERLGGVALGAVHAIDNPIADTFFETPRADGGARIFCAASIGPRKNTLGLVDAFAALTARGIDATLRIAGPRPLASYAAAVEQRVAALGLGGRVSLLPSLPTEQVREELSRASVLALVSLEENAPLTVQEAMAAGVPVVASNRCGMPFQVADGESGFLADPLDTGAIASCFERLLRDGAMREAFGRRGRELARARYHSDVVASRTRQVYELAARG
jgi:glycosyltransferase involved in cell wall biosynthesis